MERGVVDDADAAFIVGCAGIHAGSEVVGVDLSHVSPLVSFSAVEREVAIVGASVVLIRGALRIWGVDLVEGGAVGDFEELARGGDV